MEAPFIYRRPCGNGSTEDAAIMAALEGDLGRLKGIVESLGKGNGNRAAVFSLKKGGVGVLHCAACAGHLEVCMYLVEELGGDANMTAAEGVTPFMTAAQSGDVSTVKYLLDRGGDLMKADEKGRTVLHHAACTGSTKVTEFLLSKGIPVDIDYGHGTALYQAAANEQDKTVKILLDHHANAGADVNGKGNLASPLVIATMRGGYTNEVRLLLKAGADPNIPDDLGTLPVELAALNDCMEEVEMLFPLTSPIPGVPNWSVHGVISHAKLECKKPLEEHHIARRKAMFKSQASKAFKLKNYDLASKLYGLAIDHAPDATLYSNRSLCRLQMGDGEGALSDAYKCRTMRPDWAKGCYRQGAAHMLLGEHKQAHDALLDAQKLDPGNEEIERELRKAMELMKVSPDEDDQ
ncbi:putative ankyrin repeat protein RF_0381 isoform X2 [Panicum virgatum]|uniref:putative ankyrin repeat protein RF_0381 isoform X2 n=1 Tax=Panicum virgatum TaxID=38727 RepID=UPI0019D673A1|nr:putative ankyrin repeat protein RF_0381 isoform X2 [Panicum virgatum]